MKDSIDTTLADQMDLFRRLGHRCVDEIAEYLEGIRKAPVFRPMSREDRIAILDERLDDAPADIDGLVDVVRDRVFSHPMGNGHPRFFGWVNSPPAAVGILAEFLAAAVNPSCAGGDHAAVYVEHAAVRWLMELIGFPTENSMGILTSGGSTASLTCLAAARMWGAEREGWDVRKEGLQGRHPPFALYVSDQGHSCLHKSAELLGLGGDSVRVVPTDSEFRMDVVELRRAIDADRRRGIMPLAVAATAGTVNTGAVDPLEAIADLCSSERLWLHVDGAYGAVGRLDNSAASMFTGLERADSIAVDPHKWLSVPIECGCAMVRDAQLLRRAFSLVPPYLQTNEDNDPTLFPWFSEYGFQQTRGFRALKLWMVLQSVGKRGLQSRIARHNRLARYLASLLREAADFELMAEPTLSIVCFRHLPAGIEDAGEIDRLNREICTDVQANGRVFLTSTLLRERFALRACIVHDATTEGDVAAILEAIRHAARV